MLRRCGAAEQQVVVDLERPDRELLALEGAHLAGLAHALLAVQRAAGVVGGGGLLRQAPVGVAREDVHVVLDDLVDRGLVAVGQVAGVVAFRHRVGEEADVAAGDRRGRGVGVGFREGARAVRQADESDHEEDGDRDGEPVGPLLAATIRADPVAQVEVAEAEPADALEDERRGEQLNERHRTVVLVARVNGFFGLAVIELHGAGSG